VHVRRAILLFAVILALAAGVASVSEPARVPRRAVPPDEQVRASPRPVEAEDRTLHFDVSRPTRRKLETRTSGHVLVESDQPGQVELVGLGREGYAEPGAPARFELFEEEPVEAEVRFTPADESGTRPAGKIIVAKPASEAP